MRFQRFVNGGQRGNIAIMLSPVHKSFLVIALLAALFGFGGVASTAAGFAQICFFIFLVLFLVSTVAHVVRHR